MHRISISREKRGLGFPEAGRLITRAVKAALREQGVETYPLSTESCAVCDRCTYPDAPCRFPERMFPCVESHGILVLELAELFGIDFQPQGNIVTWFSLILYR